MPKDNPSPDMHIDVAVIGGGPAGATCATALAQAGVNVAVCEREHFPRFHIGESMMPDTYWPLKRIGMIDKMKASNFVKKESVQFVGRSGKLSAPFYFTDYNPHECSQTWQVLRSEFDLMMLNNAREHGAKVFEGARVRDLLCESDSENQRPLESPCNSKMARCKPSAPKWSSMPAANQH